MFWSNCDLIDLFTCQGKQPWGTQDFWRGESKNIGWFTEWGEAGEQGLEAGQEQGLLWESGCGTAYLFRPMSWEWWSSNHVSLPASLCASFPVPNGPPGYLFVRGLPLPVSAWGGEVFSWRDFQGAPPPSPLACPVGGHYTLVTMPPDITLGNGVFAKRKPEHCSSGSGASGKAK